MLLRTWVQVARASENAECSEAPFVVRAGETPVMVGWWKAASLVHLDAALGARILDPAHLAATRHLLGLIVDGTLPPAYGAPAGEAPPSPPTPGAAQ